MPLQMNCPHCGADYRLVDEAAGQKVRCVQCKEVFTVAVPADAPAEPTVVRRMQPTHVGMESAVPQPRWVETDALPVRGRKKPPPRRLSGSLLLPLLAGGAATALVLFVACGGGVWLLLHPGKSVPPTQSPFAFNEKRQDKAEPAPVNPFPINNPPVNDMPGPVNPPGGNNPPGVDPFRPQPNPQPPRMEGPRFELPPGVQLPPGIEIPGFQPAPQKPVRLGPSKPATPITYRPHVPAEKQTVKLSGTVSDVAVGGGGRYLILRLSGKRKLAVFDVQKGEVAKELPLLEEVVHFAAGAKQLLVVYPNTRLIHYWSLEKLERERSAKLPDVLSRDNIHQICMGSASLGPLFVYLPREKRTVAMDPKSLETVDVNWQHWAPNNAYGPLNMRASPDGGVLVGWDGGWAGLGIAVFHDGRQVATNEKLEFWSGSGAYALPSPDSRRIYSPWGVNDGGDRWAKVPEWNGAFLMPAIEPGYFLVLPDTCNVGSPPPNAQRDGEIAVYSDDRKRLFSLRGLEELKAKNELSWEKRIHYYPRAGLLVTLGDPGDHLTLRRVDLLEELNRSSTDYLVVLSRPPVARPGKLYSYRLDIRAKKGGVKVKLENGPEGLKVTPDGRVSWPVPPRFEEMEAEVLVTISDTSGQEVAHTIRIPVEQ